MNTQLKDDITAEVRRVCKAFSLHDMVNATEIATLIDEAQATLSPCAHCGCNDVRLDYAFAPNESKFQEHRVEIRCPECRIRTTSVDADDNDEDLREALRIVCAMWNRRPDRK